ncbi:MAG: hypothetical protein ACI8WA_000012 [Polaribacter sp.]|jgi:hypothetical protein
MKADAWKKEELNLLHKIYANSNKTVLIASFPNRSYGALKNRATLLGLKKAIGFSGKKSWKEEEKTEFKKIFATVSNPELAIKFECTINSVTHLSSKLGLKKSIEFKKQMVSKNFLEAGKKTRFNPGDVPHSKGRKREEWMSKEGVLKMNKTQFKKGSVPHNHKELGNERVTKDGYIEIKVNDFHGEKSKKNYQLKQRIVWEQHNGPIPKKMNVAFKESASKTEFTVDDLYLESNIENMNRNAMCDDSIVKRFLGITAQNQVEFIKDKLPEIIELKRNHIKLTKQIKDHVKSN